MVYQPVAEITAFFRRNDLPQLLFDFCRFLDAIHQADEQYQEAERKGKAIEAARNG